MGAEAVRRLLARLDLVGLSTQLRQELAETSSKQEMKGLTRRLKVVESLRDSDNRPEWMVLQAIPVIPPDIRPIVQLDSGNFATSDLNDLYKRVINRNTRVKKLADLNAPEVIFRNEKRMLQQAVDALFDNNRCKRPVLGSSNRPLRSLTDMIQGKQGRFRENLLGKRVDYSARSVIVVGPDLRLHQCGLPKEIALKLFQPFIIRRLSELGHADTIKSARKMLERKVEEVWDVLEEVIKNHPVLLNRAPTLHRMGIQAFEPVLVDGNAIRIHPLVCKGFNVRFDGDQMAVHLPLSIEAQVEAMTLMMSTHNIFSPANGNPIMGPTRDIVLGLYYLTLQRPGEPGEYKLEHGVETGVYFSPGEVFMAIGQGKVGTHARIKLRLPVSRRLKGEGEDEYGPGMLVTTTVGRVIFDDILHPEMPFHNLPLGQEQLQGIIADCQQLLGRAETVALLESLKDLGFGELTRSGLSAGTDDLRMLDHKSNILDDTCREVARDARRFRRGHMSDRTRRERSIEAWSKARERIAAEVMAQLRNDVRGGEVYLNPIALMIDSGAGGSVEVATRLVGMRGPTSSPSGRIDEMPIMGNLREGLGMLEYFSSTRSARKGLADIALKSADPGYLTRKIADVAQDVVITQEDCGTSQGITKGVIHEGEKIEVGLPRSIRGRINLVDIVDPITDDVVVGENEMITVASARKLEGMGIEGVRVRSPMTCEATLGICRLCYGMDLSTGQLVEPGMAVGIIAAQSIGEPGTRLTMRTFHIGGVALPAKNPREAGGARDCTGGLPRLIELFEARRPEEPAVIAEIDGRVEILDEKRRGERTILVKNESGIEREHLISYGKYFKVDTGALVQAGDALVEGPLDPHDILRVSGEEAVQRYLQREIQNVYRSQRVEIDDKHLEIIIAQMLRKVRVDSVGDTGLLPGSVIDKFEFRGTNMELMSCVKIKDPGETDFRQGDIVPRDHFDAENMRVEQAGSKKAEWIRPKPASASTQLLGITKAAVQSESFISAASFQETTKVLTEAALAGKVDYLVGLKENVILGHLVPAGTGFKSHQEAEVRIRPEALEALAEKGPGYARYPRDEAAAPAV